MTFEQYQQEAVKFRTESANNEEYLTLGLIEEVGEAAGKLAKRRRDGDEVKGSMLIGSGKPMTRKQVQDTIARWCAYMNDQLWRLEER